MFPVLFWTFCCILILMSCWVFFPYVCVIASPTQCVAPVSNCQPRSCAFKLCFFPLVPDCLFCLLSAIQHYRLCEFPHIWFCFSVSESASFFELYICLFVWSPAVALFSDKMALILNFPLYLCILTLRSIIGWRRGTPRTEFISGHLRTDCSYTSTYIQCVGRSQSTYNEHTQTQGEHANSTQKVIIYTVYLIGPIRLTEKNLDQNVVIWLQKTN